MEAELGVGVLFGATGFAVLSPIRRDLGGAVVWLSIPIGAALYLVSALIVVTVAGTLNPWIVLTTTGVIGLFGVLAGVVRRAWGLDGLLWLVITLAMVTVTVVLARTLHLTRLTPDSLRYLLFSADLLLPSALDEIDSADLLARQMGLPSLQAMAALTDRRYLASIGPLFGLSGLGIFAWFVRHHTRSMAKRQRWAVVVSAVLVLATSNRLVYDSFYINTHIEVAVFILIAVAGAWLAVTTGRWAWAFPAGLALGVSLLFRPEAPLLASLVLVAFGASRAGWPSRLTMTLPSVVVVVLWYGVILWQHASGGGTISLTAPVFGSLLAVAVATLVVVAGGFPRLQPVVGYADRVLLVSMLLALVALGAANHETLADSLVASFQNLVLGEGLWLLTWIGVGILLALAVFVHRVPEGRLWTVPIVGFVLMWWMLPILRDGPWRVGAGDSGNRILAHILAAAVAFVVLAAVQEWPRSGEGGDNKVGGLPVTSGSGRVF